MNDEKIDAITGATPKSDNLTYRWDCTDMSENPVPAGEYRFFVEGTLHWEDNGESFSFINLLITPNDGILFYKVS